MHDFLHTPYLVGLNTQKRIFNITDRSPAFTLEFGDKIWRVSQILLQFIYLLFLVFLWTTVLIKYKQTPNSSINYQVVLRSICLPCFGTKVSNSIQTETNRHRDKRTDARNQFCAFSLKL